MAVRRFYARYASGIAAGVLVVAGLALAASDPDAFSEHWRDLWATPAQQAQRLFDAGAFAAAAARADDPMRAGVAWYRAGEFERAATAFGQLSSPEAHFNRGNALLLRGAYEAAITAYDQALELRPDWTVARENRDIAQVRLARLAPPDDDAGGTGGMLGADEIVFDSSGRTKHAKGEQRLDEGGELSDAQLRALWLRRVETRPADFLRSRFARQAAQQAEQVP